MAEFLGRDESDNFRIVNHRHEFLLKTYLTTVENWSLMNKDLYNQTITNLRREEAENTISPDDLLREKKLNDLEEEVKSCSSQRNSWKEALRLGNDQMIAAVQNDPLNEHTKIMKDMNKVAFEDCNEVLKRIEYLEQKMDDMTATMFKLATNNAKAFRTHCSFKVSEIRQFSIDRREDRHACMVPSMQELTATQLIVTDWGNSCLKMIDTTTYDITNRLPLHSRPWGITKIPESRFAVTFPDVQLIKFFTNDLTDCVNPKPMQVDGRCLGIQYTKDIIIVSYIVPQPKIQMIHLNGKCLKTLEYDDLGNPLFIWPMYFTVDQDKDVIYVSDNSKCTMTCISMTGDVEWTYQDKELAYPASVTTGFGGYIYVCSKYTNETIHETIHVVSPKGVKLAVMLQSQSEAKGRLTICYSSSHKALYVSSGMSRNKKRKNRTERTKPRPFNTIRILGVLYEKIVTEPSSVVTTESAMASNDMVNISEVRPSVPEKRKLKDPPFHNQNTSASKNDETPNSKGDGSDGLTICSLNVGGLKARIDALESEKFFGKYDILCFNETHRTNTDTYGSPQYMSYVQLRKQKGEIRSGGIEIYVRKSLEPYVTNIDCNCEYILWIRLDHPAIREPLVLGSVYVPSKGKEGTGFWKEDIYSDFEHELISKCAAFQNVIITGDFNCSTGTLTDCMLDDTSSHRLFKISELFRKLSIPLDRYSMDTRQPCVSGKRLLKICNESSLFILNGRVSADKNSGKHTCVTKGRETVKTVIDYTIATGECFELVQSFDVIETHGRLSDRHNAMVFKLLKR